MDDVYEMCEEKTSDEMLEQIISEIKFLRNQLFDIKGSLENEFGKMERRLLSKIEDNNKRILSEIELLLKK